MTTMHLDSHPDRAAPLEHIEPWGSEQIITCHDARAGLRAVVVIDDSRLGPALGGVRCQVYPTFGAALLEAQRLAASATLRHALADLPYGGGTVVVLGSEEPQTPAERRGLMVRLGEFLAQLSERYIAGVDMGTANTDLLAVREGGATVYGADSDPTVWTARGVFAAMRAGVLHRFGASGLGGMTVAVQGAGAVGSALARFVSADGGTALVADLDHDRALRVAEEVGGRPIDVSDAAVARCDVFAPCASTRVLTPDVVERMQCGLVAGSAPDILDVGAAEAIAAAGIALVPDVIAGAGGAIHEHARVSQWSEDELAAAVDAIGSRVLGLFTDAQADGLTAHDLAMQRAAARLDGLPA